MMHFKIQSDAPSKSTNLFVLTELCLLTIVYIDAHLLGKILIDLITSTDDIP